MAGRSIHWHDGMFMWPHHMQQEERFRAHEAARQNKWNVHYNWGLRTLDLDLEPLKNHRLVLRSLRARMRDGTVIDAPEDCPLPTLDLKEGFAKHERVTVLLAAPRENQPNIDKPDGVNSATGPAEGEALAGVVTRYRHEWADLDDENSGADMQVIPVRRLNVKLLLETDDLAGYECLPILRLQRTPGKEGVLQRDESYIPPLLACDAWQPLAAGILQATYDKVGSRLSSLANQIVSRNITFDSRNTGDAVLLGQLAVLNEAYATLNTLAFAEGVHPFLAYLELCRLVGKLAIYQPARRVPGLPPYNHDDLGFCFTKVLQHLEAIEPTKAEYFEKEFEGEELRMQVGLEPRWLEPAYQMFVGVTCPLKSEDVVRLLTRAGQNGLDMKIGSADRVDGIFQKGMTGLAFRAVDRPPRDLPSSPDLTYFQVNREASKEEWVHVQRPPSRLAIRINQKLLVDKSGATVNNLQGQTVLTVRLGTTATTTLRFVLYIVPQQS